MAENDPLPAALAEIRTGLEAAALAFGPPPLDPARASYAAGTLHGSALKALAAVEAALRHHRPEPLYGNAATGEEPDACPHDPDADCHFESDDGEWLCELKREGTACSGCPGLPDGERIPWPCDEYQAILAALTGKEVPDA